MVISRSTGAAPIGGRMTQEEVGKAMFCLVPTTFVCAFLSYTALYTYPMLSAIIGTVAVCTGTLSLILPLIMCTELYDPILSRSQQNDTGYYP